MRKKKNFSQEYVAEKLGYKSYTTIQKWESGVSEPSIKKLHELAELFGVDVEALINSEMVSESFLAIFAKFSEPISRLNDAGREKLMNDLEDMLSLKKYTEGD